MLMIIYPDNGLAEDPNDHLVAKVTRSYILELLWGFAKEEVYKISVANLGDLKLRIRLPIQNVTIDMLRNTWI